MQPDKRKSKKLIKQLNIDNCAKLSFTRRDNRKIVVPLFFVALFIFVLSPFIIAYTVLPESILLIEGKEELFDFKIPVTAVFKNEKVPAFNLNNEKVNTNEISLNDKLSVVSKEAGETEITLNVLGILPLKRITVATIPDIDVIPCGEAVGVRINTDGIMVLGTSVFKNSDGKESDPAKNVLKAGDLIVSANGEMIENKEQLTGIIEKSNGKEISFEYNRNGEIMNTELLPIKSNDGSYKLGIWVRDSTQGIGTVTYYNPETLKFGALGHGIVDVDTKKIMTIKDGIIMNSSITDSKKGKKGVPGELLGNIENNNVLGRIEENSRFGVFGYIDSEKKDHLPTETMKIALQSEVEEGDAFILSTIEGESPKKYSVKILSINKYSNDDSKGMIVRITDDELLKRTNGIVQGMSGSPIIQNDKLVGAVTHVFVQDPTKGYGIFIENMLKQEKSY